MHGDSGAVNAPKLAAFDVGQLYAPKRLAETEREFGEVVFDIVQFRIGSGDHIRRSLRALFPWDGYRAGRRDPNRRDKRRGCRATQRTNK